MNLYSSVPVAVTYQNFGSAWLGILRGKQKDIELVFNGLFNLSACNGELDYHDYRNTVATFWTSRKAMRRFFFNQSFHPVSDIETGRGQLIRKAMRFAKARLAEMTLLHERFMSFADKNRYAPDTFGTGTIVAARPDHDMKDEILFHAFTEKTESKTVDVD